MTLTSSPLSLRTPKYLGQPINENPDARREMAALRIEHGHGHWRGWEGFQYRNQLSGCDLMLHAIAWDLYQSQPGNARGSVDLRSSDDDLVGQRDLPLLTVLLEFHRIGLPCCGGGVGDHPMAIEIVWR